MKHILLTSFSVLLLACANATQILIPMDESQSDHLRAYGVTYQVLARGGQAQWLLNYRGGSFLFEYSKDDETACADKGIVFQVLPEASVKQIMKEIENPVNNMNAVQMARPPKIAVHRAPGVELWDDPVTLVLNYAGIAYDAITDEQILEGKLQNYDWLHVHHEDFSGQYGRFFADYREAKWYKDQVAANEKTAASFGYYKVSVLKLAVAKQIRNFISNGGFFFAMCSATDSYDIALAAEGVDICSKVFDGDPADQQANTKLNFDNCFAFRNFELVMNPMNYEFSNIDSYNTRSKMGVTQTNDFFSLAEYSALNEKELCMLTQNHVKTIKGFWGQTTAFNLAYLKDGVDVMGANKSFGEARYIHGNVEKGMWTFFAGHDPEDYQHHVGENPTDISKYPNSPGYRLILDNVLLQSTRVKQESSANFRSYPNPAANVLTLEYEMENAGATVVIFDASGKEMLRQNLSPDAKTVALDVSYFATGAYVWRIESNGMIVATEKFSVVR
jgi:hypothetical protein